MLRLFRIHTVPPEAEEEGSTWLQLFFDLVYVVILVELGGRLGSDLTLGGTIQFVFLFIPIWWSWVQFVNYGSRFPIDDIGQRILTVLYMAAMLLMAFEIHAVTGVTARAFVLAYAFSKLILALMYARVTIQFPKYRARSSRLAVTFVLISLLWIGIALVDPTNFWLWGPVVILGIVVPPFVSGREEQNEKAYPPIKYHFLKHRFGELTIIVLGEFFIKLVTSSSGRNLESINLYIGFCLLAISVSLWWLYFDHLEHTSLTTAGSRKRLWFYSHYPFLAAITAYGVVGTQVFSTAAGQPLDDPKRLLLTTALATALLAFGAIEWASGEREETLARRPQTWIFIAGAASLLALGIWGGALNAGIQVTIVASVFVLQVSLDIYKRLRHSDPRGAQGASLGANAHT